MSPQQIFLKKLKAIWEKHAPSPHRHLYNASKKAPKNIQKYAKTLNDINYRECNLIVVLHYEDFATNTWLEDDVKVWIRYNDVEYKQSNFVFDHRVLTNFINDSHHRETAPYYAYFLNMMERDNIRLPEKHDETVALMRKYVSMITEKQMERLKPKPPSDFKTWRNGSIDWNNGKDPCVGPNAEPMLPIVTDEDGSMWMKIPEKK